MSEDEFNPLLDCEHYLAGCWDPEDGTPPSDILCTRADEYIEEHLPCYDCMGKWSAEQICDYIRKEEEKHRKAVKRYQLKIKGSEE